jgi:hypothetical protein
VVCTAVAPATAFIRAFGAAPFVTGIGIPPPIQNPPLPESE